MLSSLKRFSINTATLGYSLPITAAIEKIAGAGFGGLAPWRRDLAGQNINEVARQIRDSGLSVSGYCRSTYFPAIARDQWQKNVDDNKRALNEAAELQADCFVLVVGGLPHGSRDLVNARNQVEDGISALLEVAVELNVPLALEPLHPMYAADRACVNTLDQALDICRRLSPANNLLGIAIDAYHTWWDPKLTQMIERVGSEKRVLACHVNDWLVPTCDLLMDRGIPGDGIIDLPSFCKLVKAQEYAGLFELEIFSSKLWENSVEDILMRAVKACLYCIDDT